MMRSTERRFSAAAVAGDLREDGGDEAGLAPFASALTGDHP
jgi:hypothetical protein